MPDPGSCEILTFEVAGRSYALPGADVVELFRAVRTFSLPQAPAGVEGVINVRGVVVRVLDIRKRFGLPAKEAEPSDHLILARAGQRLAALRVDRAVGLVRVAASAVQDQEKAAPGADGAAGIAKLPDGLVMICDLAAFLGEEKSP